MAGVYLKATLYNWLPLINVALRRAAKRLISITAKERLRNALFTPLTGMKTKFSTTFYKVDDIGFSRSVSQWNPGYN